MIRHARQSVGEAAHYLRLEAILAPSAAGTGIVVAVYLEKLRPGSALEPTSSEMWEHVPPRRS